MRNTMSHYSARLLIIVVISKYVNLSAQYELCPCWWLVSPSWLDKAWLAVAKNVKLGLETDILAAKKRVLHVSVRFEVAHRQICVTFIFKNTRYSWGWKIYIQYLKMVKWRLGPRLHFGILRYGQISFFGPKVSKNLSYCSSPPL